MKRYRTQELFKENIENLAKQLDQAKQQLAQWEKWYQTVKGDLRVIEKSSSSLGKVGTKLSKAMANLTLSIEEGGKLFKQKRRVNKKVCLDLHHLIEKKKKNNQELKILIEELNSSGSKEVQKLIPQLEGFLSSWKAKRDRLQRLVDGLTKKCLSDVGCPHCKKKFVPLKAYVQQKRINNVAKSQ
ncbi:hypothetical protein [Candidatus Neptunochlamydia vexilliferae]|uniref:hypothetical protein n=1 Tax=Candidatus Neptunichlamydia vexilliferae TaxID=1651774 RepID=UPI0018913399|nr:hypothetical protein [Candidatus Neptunochlamydia vexilliferae]